MNLLHPLSATPGTSPLLNALGWTLLHFLWQGALIALLLWCALALLAPAYSRLRYALASAALAFMAFLPAVTFLRLAQLNQDAAATTVVAAPWLIAVDVSAAGGREPLAQRAGELLATAAPILPWIWLAGVLFCAARLAAGLLTARRLRRSGTSAPPSHIQALFHDVARRLRLHRAIQLAESLHVEVPTVIGWLRPVVLLPAACFTGLAPDQIEALLAHELAHIRRHDYLVSVLQGVVESLLFYHPAVWWVSRQLRRERECCCDAVAASCTGDNLQYARALSFLEEQRLRPFPAGLNATGGVLRMRIHRLLGYPETSAVSRGAALAILTLLLCSGGVLLAHAARPSQPAPSADQAAQPAQPAQPQTAASAPGSSAQNATLSVPARPRGLNSLARAARPSPQQEGPPPSASLKTAYVTWLNQDVLWIITPEERTAFLNLANDDERDTFIQQFWLRRDPPGSAPDTYRSEHYARIAYSNQHFATDHPGWKSDRGHAYIAYGKPDSIESHPNGGGAGAGSKPLDYPNEVWHYAHIPSLGDNVTLTFADTCRCGQYNITLGRVLAPPAGGQRDGAERTWREVTLDAAISRASTISTDPLAGRNIREIDYKGLNSITISDLRSRLDSDNVRLSLETPYDPAKTAAVSTLIQQLLAQHGRSRATVQLITRAIPPNSVALLFDIHEGPALVPASYSAPSRPAPAPQSAPDSTLSGTVVDPTGAVMPRVKIVAINAQTGQQSTQQSSESGAFTFTLPAGKYTLAASAIGFKTTLAQVASLTPAEPVHLTLKLPVAGTSENLLVRASAPQQEPAPGDSNPNTAPAGPIRVSPGVSQSQLLDHPNPLYPAEARAAHISGTVVLRAVISKDGNVDNLVVVSGPDMLQSAALDAVKRWKYKPYLLNGQPTAVDTSIRVNFTFADPSSPPPPPAAPGASVTAGRPIRVSGGIMAGQAISQPPPTYPAEAKAAHLQGTVVLHAVISKEGEIEDLQVVRGPPELTASAIDAVKQWLYKPYLLNGEPTAVETTINVNYTFGGG